ncbi:carbonic anhydrase 1 [Folsomia candida]|uniref:Carbonic anhydrase n=1 Tax=Folsomia candida TaxID=158441 RepID=A0A226F256_FOLCA|nr:carbonic anhydrase 1 [Folsomia candida]OXA63281.1 Carbonic anhydrase [Folsomia candida]
MSVLLYYVIFVIFLKFCLFKESNSQFCYTDPTCGPATWPGVCTTGGMQSPINFDGMDTTVAFLPSNFRHVWENLPIAKNFLILNAGHTVEVLFPPGQEPKLKGSAIGLPGEYTFAQLHFHWGTSDTGGSEHTLFGKQYALEMHMVHYATPYGSYAAASVAPNDPNAVAILAIFFEISPVNNVALIPITKAIPLVRRFNRSQEIDVTGFLNLKNLLPAHLNFYRYEGSLTSPDCHENRVWTVFKQPVKISKQQMKQFRTVFDDRGEIIVENHRPLQARNGRPITFYFVTESLFDKILKFFTAYLSAWKEILLFPFQFLGNPTLFTLSFGRKLE